MYADLLYPMVGDGGNVEQVLVFVFRQDEVGEVLVGIGRTGTYKWTDREQRAVGRQSPLYLFSYR